jgi:hypothetical protein
MERRQFLGFGAAALGLGAGSLEGSLGATSEDEGVKAGPAKTDRQIYELRMATFDTPQSLDAFATFVDRVYAPALGRAGVASIGSFRLRAEDNSGLAEPWLAPRLWMLLAHETMDSVLTITERLGTDAEFLEKGRDVIFAPKEAPAFRRIESSLLIAFDGMRRLEVPTRAESRLLQLRIYESHSIERHLRKVAMFDEGGEIGIFRRTGLKPVFFGRTVVGPRMPNLTYMLAFDDRPALDAAWNMFRADPEWVKLRSDETYKDTVSEITNLILRPTPGSKI